MDIEKVAAETPEKIFTVAIAPDAGLQDYQARASSKDRYGRRGTFVAMEQTYNAYRGVKIQEQDLDEMALGFNNEVAPTLMEVSGRVFRLNGTLDSQYTEWRGILREIFSLETGLPPAS